MTSLLNFIKIYQLVQKLLRGTHRQTDRQDGDLISLTFVFKESRLNIKILKFTMFRKLSASFCKNIPTLWGPSDKASLHELVQTCN
jgi:hypothetical protein